MYINLIPATFTLRRLIIVRMMQFTSTKCSKMYLIFFSLVDDAIVILYFWGWGCLLTHVLLGKIFNQISVSLLLWQDLGDLQFV